MQKPEEWSVQIAGALIFPIPILFNKLGYYRWAKILCLILPYFYLSALTIYWGSARGSQLIIFACSGLSVLFFDKRSSIYSLIALGGLCIIAVEWYNFENEPIYVTEKLGLAHIVNVIVTMILLAVTSAIFKSENEKYQKKIQSKNNQITQQHSQLLRLHNDLKDSVNLIKEQTRYAQTIQQSILPLESEMKRLFPEHFVFFKPKEIVSGDFYFATKVHEKIFIAAIDCTGHGVPGAFMSMIAYNLLLEAIELNYISEPARILDYLQERIAYSLKQQHTDNSDGMDISVCMIDRANKVLEYAGAKHPLLMVENGILKKIEADRVSIGGTLRKSQHKFLNHKFDMERITNIYLFTDGYRDQYGGREFKRFMSKRFLKLLEEMHNQSAREQKNTIMDTFAHWAGRHEQTDDVLVIGIRL